MASVFTLEIEKMVYGGAGMGRIHGKVVFVPFTAPGDQVAVELVQEKKDFAEATLRKIHRPSASRTTPFCSLFGICGGCQYQHIRYPDQIQFKEDIVREFLDRRIREKKYRFLPMLPSSPDRSYRLRAQFKGGRLEGREILGFYAAKSHRVIEVKSCPLLYPLANELLQTVQTWREEVTENLILQGVDIQVSPDERKGVIGFKTKGECNPVIYEELFYKSSIFKGIIVSNEWRRVWGEASLFYQASAIAREGPLTIYADYDSFTQVNPYQNINLIQILTHWASLTGREQVVDLYCGSGNLSLPLARKARMLWGIDSDGKAISRARQNAKLNGLDNTRFIATPAKEGVLRILPKRPSIDLVVLDPPRAGAADVLVCLVSLRPERILYVSCEPPTLFRDLARLERLGYRLLRIQPLDMFPQTYHIEVIAELGKTS